MPGWNFFGKPYLAQEGGGGSGPPIWGVDSSTPANVDLPDPDFPGTTVKFYDLVVRRTGRTPNFWGRYIGGQLFPQFNLTRQEVLYLASKNCRILVNYNRLNNTLVSTEPGGIQAATTAQQLAGTLGVPGGKQVRIYCNIEPTFTSVSRNFFRGWFNTLQSSGYLGGVYGDTSVGVFNTEYCAAYQSLSSTSMSDSLLWTNRPSLTCDIINRQVPFNPRPPGCTPPTPLLTTAIYQYSINCPLVPRAPPASSLYNYQIDLDLALFWGFKTMWAPPAWEAFVIDLHNDVNNSGIVCAPSLERLPDSRLVAVMAVAHAANSPADLGAYVSQDDGQTWAAPVELTNLPVGLPQTMVERNGNILAFAGANPIYQAMFDTTLLEWHDFQQNVSGIRHPDSAPSLSLQAGGGLLASNQYEVSYTYKGSGPSQESSSSPAATILTSNTQLTVHCVMPSSSNPIVNTIAIYVRNVTLGETMRRLAGSVANPASGNATFDITANTWGGQPSYPPFMPWRSWYAPGGTAIFRFLRAARTFDRTQAAVTALSSDTSSPFIPIASDGTAGAAQTIPVFGTIGPLMLRWVGASPQVARMRPFDQLQYVSGQLYFDPSVPQYIDLYTQSGATWSFRSTYTVDSLSKLTAPTNPDVMQVLRRGLWNVDYAWGPGTVAANGSDMYGFFSDNPIRADAGGLSGLLSGRWRRQVGGVWTEDPVNFASDAYPPLNEQNYNLHSQAMWLHDNEFRAVIEVAGPTYPGNGHYWFVHRFG